MLHALDLVTFSLNKIVGSLFHSLVTDGMNQAKKICLFPSECPGQFFLSRPGHGQDCQLL